MVENFLQECFLHRNFFCIYICIIIYIIIIIFIYLYIIIIILNYIILYIIILTISELMTFLGAHTLFSYSQHLFFLFKVYYSYCLEQICRLICKFCFFLFDGEGGGDFVPPPFGGATDRPAGGGGGGSPSPLP